MNPKLKSSLKKSSPFVAVFACGFILGAIWMVTASEWVGEGLVQAGLRAIAANQSQVWQSRIMMPRLAPPNPSPVASPGK